MTEAEAATSEQPATTGGTKLNWTLELVLVPVSDVDRAKAFYMDKAGFGLDVDHSAGEDFRVVQLTPPGSACAIALMRGDNAGAAQGLHLCVEDIEAARAELVGRGMDAGEPWHMEGGSQVAGPDPQRQSYASFFTFNDPDGNGWLVQEKKR